MHKVVSGSLAGACEDLFYQIVRNLAATGELTRKTVFIEGTKLETYANKRIFVWKKSVGKWSKNRQIEKPLLKYAKKLPLNSYL